MENDALIGQQIGGYTIQSKLGEGGMARVYKAYQARLRREVAIKVILSQIAEQSDFKVRFEREAQVIASLQHPNIVAVYDVGDWGNLTYLVMQYVGGGTLRDLLRGGHALDPRLATQYAIQMGKALHHAHLRGIVHRDVKPQNMLVSSTDPNHLLLSDFGIAKLFDTRYEPTLINPAGSAIGSDASLTSMGQMVGTAEYMAPEQIEGRPVDARTDVYALGIVLFQVLAGEAPFHSTTVQGLLYQHIHIAPRQIRDINPYVSEHLSWIVSKAMAKAPSDRFQSAEEMAQALEAANSHATYPLPPSMPAMPGSGQATQDPLNLPSQQRPSFYTQPSQSGAPALGVASQYGQQQVFGNTPAYGTSRSSTHPSGVSAITPPRRLAQRRLLPGYVGAALVVLLAIVLILAKTGILPLFGGGSTGTTTAAQSFIDNFHDNHLQWTIGSVQGLNAGISQNSYVLDIPQASQANTFFPYPKGVGYLPDNFTWSVMMEQTTGQAPYDVYYGLAFRLTQDSSGVSCYAFIINGQGHYEVLKYIPGSNYRTLAQGQSPAIHTGLNQTNSLQAKVQGNNLYFSINGTPVEGQGHPITDISGSSPYTNGEPALFVAGSNTSEVSFTVTQAQLMIG